MSEQKAEGSRQKAVGRRQKAEGSRQKLLPSAFCVLPTAFCLILCAILFFYRLADRDLWNSHEGRAAQDAQTMLDQGDWGMPRLYDGEAEMQKPPLYYWLVATVAWLRAAPVDAWAVRLPAALAATACILSVYWWGHRRERPMLGFVAAIVLASAVHFTWLARVGRIDMPLTLCITLALFGYYAASRSRCSSAVAVRPTSWAGPLSLESGSPTARTYPALLLAYLAVAAGILFKGPIALALPAVVMVGHLAVERELPFPWRIRDWVALLHRFGLWWGLPLVAALVLPWFLWANAATDGEWFHSFFWRHNVERGLGGGADGEDHWNHPWWLYGPIFLWDFLPWSIFLLPVVWYCFTKGWWRNDAEARFALIWFVAMMGLLSCMRFKRGDYLLPAYPGAALFLACIAERWHQRLVATGRALPRAIAVVSFSMIVVSCIDACIVNVEWLIPRKEATREYRRFAAQIREFASPAQPVLFFQTDRHALVFHVGQPVAVFVEWEKLDAWAARPEPAYVVMPERTAQEWPLHLKLGRLEEVARNTSPDGRDHEKPLVLLRTRSNLCSRDP